MLLVEHYVKAVLENCDLSTSSARGQIIAAGTPDEIVADPQVRAVYLGEDYQQREEVRRRCLSCPGSGPVTAACRSCSTST